jgi:hypothetical protein
MRFEVQTNSLCGGWENCWTTIDANNNETPTTFATSEEAETAITDHLAEVKAAVEAGDMAEEDSRDDYRVVEINADKCPDSPDGKHLLCDGHCGDKRLHCFHCNADMDGK